MDRKEKDLEVEIVRFDIHVLYLLIKFSCAFKYLL